MKQYIIMLLAAFLSMGCNSQEKESKNEEIAQNEENTAATPKGSWSQ